MPRSNLYFGRRRHHRIWSGPTIFVGGLFIGRFTGDGGTSQHRSTLITSHPRPQLYFEETRSIRKFLVPYHLRDIVDSVTCHERIEVSISCLITT
jgi:hypothetical protein